MTAVKMEKSITSVSSRVIPPLNTSEWKASRRYENHSEEQQHAKHRKVDKSDDENLVEQSDSGRQKQPNGLFSIAETDQYPDQDHQQEDDRVQRWFG